MDEESQRFRRITTKVLTMQLNSTSVMDIIAYGGAAVGMIVTLSEFAKGNVSFGGALMFCITGFAGTGRDNLKMGKPDVTEEEMCAVLEKVNLFGFLQAQQGLDTLVMEKGSNFSGGQCQRLALARALLHDTPVYIFDEATSNIDMESEEMIMEVIRELAKTILLISHRLANVVESDRIYMLENGSVVQAGTHRELVAEGGAYERLYRYQSELEAYGKEDGKVVAE